MIIWILFGHLMTPEQHQMTTEIQCSRSGKFEVIASIRSQPKQRSENQRVGGSSPSLHSLSEWHRAGSCKIIRTCRSSATAGEFWVNTTCARTKRIRSVAARAAESACVTPLVTKQLIVGLETRSELRLTGPGHPRHPGRRSRPGQSPWCNGA
jgi:hypothetical protein